MLKIPKDYLIRAALPRMENAGGSEPCGKGTCKVYHFIIRTNTFTTKAYVEVFKIQSGHLNCNSEKVLYLLWCKISDDTPYVGKAISFVFGLITIKVSTDHVEKERRIYHRSVFIHIMLKIAKKVLTIGKSSLYLRKVKRTTKLKKGKLFGT